MTARRRRIKPELMEALQMVKFGHSRGRGLDFTSGTSEDDEILALEGHERLVAAVPDDLTMYIRSLVENPAPEGEDEGSDDDNEPQ